eukprot:TRINITY_DN123239_c0_g1_i1.p1 TRINITY_DN123239_c0_g1~~TRINITY_DN123239_c0_g1_i1.p1  ORF type:complete len:748 (-),score=167.08 TRINITY_DN123239_c0_g1_i1:111-2354(-)
MYGGGYQTSHFEDDHKYDRKAHHTHCTDPICFIIYVVCLVGWAFCYGYGWQNGNTAKLYHGIDWSGRVCGVDVGVETLPMVYWCVPPLQQAAGMVAQNTNLTMGNAINSLAEGLTPICVSNCSGLTLTTTVAPAVTAAAGVFQPTVAPTIAGVATAAPATFAVATTLWTPGAPVPAPQSVVRRLQTLAGIATTPVTATGVATGVNAVAGAAQAEAVLASGAEEALACAAVDATPKVVEAPWETTPFMGRYCVPPSGTQAADAIYGQLETGQLASYSEIVMQQLASVFAAWPVLLSAFVVSVAAGYLYLLVLKCGAEPLMWVTMIGTILGFAGLAAYLWINMENLAQSMADQGQGTVVSSAVDSTGGQMVGHARTSLKVGAGFCALLSLAAAILTCCCCTSIRVAARCTEVACDVIFEIPVLLVAPIVKAVFKGFAYVVCLYGFALLYTTAEPTTPGSDGMIRTFSFTNEQYGMLVYYMFCSFWILAFMDALYQFVVAFVVQDYYYEPYHDIDGAPEKDIDCCAICDGLQLGLFTHAGTLAFGSAIIALLQTLQKIIEYAEKKNKEAGDSTIVRCILACLHCCVSCCKEIVEQVNKNAYIACSIEGTNFCESASQALGVMASTMATMMILNGATWVFTFFGTLFVCGITGVSTYYAILHYLGVGLYGSDGGMAILVVACCIAAGTALCFMHVFDMTSDTLVYCYGNDRRQGLPGATAPRPLQDLFSDADRSANEKQMGHGPGDMNAHR